MRVTVLGNPDRYLAPLEGGSGYLLEAGGARVLLDCGPGIREALRAVDPGTIDAVVISHFHYDHALDLLTVLREVPKGTPLFAPSGARGNLAALSRAFGFEGAFETPGHLHEGRAAEVHQIKKLRLDFTPTEHSLTSMATRGRVAGRAFVYASDTRACPTLHELARKADLVVAHTLMPTVDGGSEHAKIHMTAETAAEFAKLAQVKRLVLSHRFHESKDEDMLGAAKKSFEAVELAARGGVYDVA